MTFATDISRPLSPLDWRLSDFVRSPMGPVMLGGAASLAILSSLISPAFQASSPAPVVSAPVARVKPYVSAQMLAAPPPSIDDGQVDTRALLQSLFAKAGLRPRFLEQLTWDQARKLNAVLPAAVLPPDAAKPFLLSTDSKDGQQALHCLTQAAYYEAGAAGPEAEAAVVQVVLNRLRHPNFPKSICGVVYEGSGRASGCQFTFTCDGALGREVDVAAFAAARRIALRALSGYVVPAVGAATYYHADYVFPAWAPTLVKMTTIGPHIFYRMTGEAGRATYLTGRYAGGELKLAPQILYAVDSVTQKGEAAGPGRPIADRPGSVTLGTATAGPGAALVPSPILAVPKIEVVQAPAASAPLLSSPPVAAAPVAPLLQTKPPELPRRSYFGDSSLSHGLAPDPFRR